MINTLNELISITKSFSMPEGIIEKKEKGRQEFTLKFPIQSIQNLTVEDYCVGTTENSFCYWLEFKEILFGVGGGNASKFGIYKSKDGNYYEGYGPKKTALSGNNLEDKFSVLKQDIIKGLKYVEQNQIEKISEIKTPIWNMILLKIFCIYYPDKFLTIGDPEVIIECAKNIGIVDVELKNENSVLINYLCRKKLNETEAFSTWEYEKIGTLIWQTFKDSAKRDYYLIGSKYGVNADKDIFPEMLNQSVIATGFAPNIDLSGFYNKNHSEIKEFLQSHNEESNSINALKYFLSLRPGDLVAVKGDGSPKGTKGYLSIIGIAEVTEKNRKVYEYDPKGLVHIINVKFLEAPIFKELALGGYGRTIHKLSNEEHIKLIFKSNTEMSYFEELNKFLAQTETNDLKTSHYLKKYLGLDVKVSFGQGNQAKIPWIAFLNEIDTVQEGIYPGYLYFKEKKLLILAHCISETHKPTRNWNETNLITIDNYFTEYGLGKPERYGNSFVFKVYNINQQLVESEINRNLNELIAVYNAIDGNPLPLPVEKFDYKNFNLSLSQASLFIEAKLSLRFAAALLTKPFVILTGLSGSGKTKLAQAFAMWICENNNQYCIVPVGADWTNREPLLGFPNALQEKEYVKPDNRVLDLIIDANNNPDKPYFLILDEMNLSHVERYFADFLSVMESKSKISLHSGSDGWNGVPSEIGFPKNLFTIGTVNIDETTYMFSPKVLDRANVIEFRVTAKEMGGYLKSNFTVDLANLEGHGANMASNFVQIAKDNSLEAKETEELNITLLSFFSELKKTGAEFGYRSASEILRFAAVVNKIESTWSMSDIIDAAIMQKLLPKVHGSRRKLSPVLETLGALCLHNKIKEGEKIENYLYPKTEKDISDHIKYPLSFEKISRMYKNLIDNGFTSYAEA
jgi:5-methylcytosine-specific restriction protein B